MVAVMAIHSNNRLTIRNFVVHPSIPSIYVPSPKTAMFAKPTCNLAIFDFPSSVLMMIMMIAFQSSNHPIMLILVNVSIPIIYPICPVAMIGNYRVCPAFKTPTSVLAMVVMVTPKSGDVTSMIALELKMVIKPIHPITVQITYARRAFLSAT